MVTGFAVIRPMHVPDRPRNAFERVWQGNAERGGGTSFAQQMFGRDLFYGQGILDLDAFRAALRGRIPENSVLSHDKLEGMYAATGSIGGAVIVEGSIGDYLAFRQRAHRWARGDVHLLPWIGGGSLPLLGRWVLFSDLAGHLWPPATLSLLVLAWVAAPPGQAGAWTLAVLATYLLGAIFTPLAVLLGRLQRRPRGVRELASTLVWRGRLSARLLVAELAGVPLWIALLADSALVEADATARALYRTLVSRRHVLQWTPSARAGRAVSTGLATRWRHLRASCALAVALAVAVAAIRPASATTRRLLNALGVRLSDVLSADRILIVEGPSDEDVLSTWFPSLRRNPRVAILHGNGGDAARHADRLAAWLAAADRLSARRVLYVRDRDELPESLLAKLGSSSVVHVLRRRELENYLIDAKALAAVLADLIPKAAAAPTVEDVQAAISEALDDVRSAIVISPRYGPAGYRKAVDACLASGIGPREGRFANLDSRGGWPNTRTTKVG